MNVPVLDLASDDADRLAREFDDTCRRVGFCAVVNHGVPEAVLARARESAAAFFILAPEEKIRVAMPKPGYPYGYSGLAEEDLERSYTPESNTTGDLKESLSIGPPGSWADDPDVREPAYRTTPTQWPNSPDTLRSAWIAYYREMEVLCRRLMRLAARALALPSCFFDGKFDQHMSAFRALHYPPAPAGARRSQPRAGAHTDYGGITVLYPQPGSRGLQILRPEGWADVRADEGTFIVNIGDLMARWTNDRWVSTMHRVRHEATQQSRHSLAFFYNPNEQARIECLPSCLAPGETAKYPPVLAGSHLMTKYRLSIQRAN